MTSGTPCSSGADLTGSSFKEANLSPHDFTGAILDCVDFTGANVAGAVFTHSTWSLSQGLEKNQRDQILAAEGHPPVKDPDAEK